MGKMWTGVRGVASTVRAVAEMAWRWLRLREFRLRGRIARLTSRGWLLAVKWLVLVVLILVLGPFLIDKLSALAGDIGVWSLLHEKAPQVSDWLTPWALVAGVAALFVIHVVGHARRRVIIEDFVDYTSDAAKAVDGLSTLLVAELGRLRGLYQHVNDQLSVSTSVGVSRRGDVGSSTEPGSFLTVRADEMSDMLSSAVASEGQIHIGMLSIPIGTVFSILGRLVKGPRLLGSVHLTEAGGGPMLTAQIVGRKQPQAWRVDLTGPPGRRVDRAYLDPMVSELACRMFTDLTLRGTVRWRAMDRFTDYLRLYSESLRTPKNRARYLREAEGALLEAIAEDESFSLAFYNLGVIYSQLADTERRSAAAAGLGKPIQVKQTVDPDNLHQARVDAALAAFQHALDVDPGRWDAVYALGVHRYTQVEDQVIDAADGPVAADRRIALRQQLERVVQLCDRVIDLDPSNAQARDLRGLSNRRLAELECYSRLAELQADPWRTAQQPEEERAKLESDCRHARGLLAAAMRDHRSAVRRSWRRLCEAEFAECASPATTDGVLATMRANAGAALRNLAVAYELRATGNKGLWRWLRYWSSDFVFAQALALAPPKTIAVTHFERGAMREMWGRPAKATKAYRLAAKIDRDNPCYWASLARAHAAAGSAKQHQRQAGEAAFWALEALAPVFRRSLEPFPMRATLRLRDTTLASLAQAYDRLGDAAGSARVRRIGRLADELPDASLDRLESLERSCESDWERFQIEVVKARLLERERRWGEAEERYRQLVEHPPASEGVVMSEPMLRVRRAKALRKRSRFGRLNEPDRAKLLRGALEQAAQALLTDPLNPSVRREVGKAHFDLGQYAEALEVWEHTLSLTPNDPYLCFKMGLCNWQLAQDRHERGDRLEVLGQARSWFDHAGLLFGLESIEQWTWSLLWRGRAALEQGELDRAIRDLRSALSSPRPRLAASILLAEAYHRAGDEAVSHRWFSDSLAELDEGDGSQCLDKGWGDTMSRYEARAWAGCAVATSAANHDCAEKLERLEEALDAARQIPDDRSRAHWTARCLDALGKLRSADDLATAVNAVEQAGGLVSSPEILLHLLELYEAQATRQQDRAKRLEIIGQAEQAVRRLKRLETCEAAYADDAGEILLRLRALTPAVAGNGHRRRLRLRGGQS